MRRMSKTLAVWIRRGAPPVTLAFLLIAPDAGKRDCCNEAIALAEEDSAIACRNVGGMPSPMRGGAQRRGFCSWESRRDDDGVLGFRCQAEATVSCR